MHEEATTGNVHRFGKVAKRVAPRAKLVEGADTGVSVVWMSVLGPPSHCARREGTHQ